MNHLFFGLTAGMTLSLQAQDKPNVLFIAVDDLKPLLGCYGQDYMITPHIDELAGNGVIFTNAHCQQAVSGPTRASLLTGMRPDYTGVWDLKTRMRDVNPDILAMPQYFKQQGYQTVAIGKIYDPRCVDEDYDRPSWSVPYAKSANYIYPEAYGEPAYSYYASAESKQIVARLEEEAREKGIREVRNYAIEKYKPSVECADYPDEAYQDGQICNNALSYMKEMAGSGEPFFLAVGFKRPHLPFSAPKKYWDLYDRDKVHLAEYQKAVKGGVDIAYHKHEELQSYTDIPKIESFSDIFTKLIPEDKQRELIHGYYACVSFIDAQVGKLMAELQELGLEKNTIVILWGDHGWHLGDHALWCKHTNFEQATRVPMIISVPGEQPGSYSMPVEFVDIFPTLCDAMGLDIPAHLQGKSLMPAIQDKNVRIKDFAVSQFDRGNNHGYTIRTDRYRFTVWMKDDYRTWMPFEADRVLDCEMYDYQTDPNETLNLYRLPEYEGLVNEMWERFTGFVKTQNQELAGAAPGKPKKKAKTRPQKTDAGI
ncbi:MAG: sulfatase, partial [Deltaproteobacteria bacterium]|nr:sulfatase [Deltaproteobacteria bacterium]